MRRLTAIVLAGLLTVLGLASQASAVTITNGTVTLGVNPQGDLNDVAAGVGLTYNDTGNDGTIEGTPAEGWGAGADGPLRFQGRANEEAGNDGYAVPVTFTSNATEAVSVVDILRDGVPALRLTQDFHPSPATPYLYEITTTLENLSDGPLTDVRYERVMNWQVEPTAAEEFVTVNRGPTPPSSLIYSDDNGFGDDFPFSDRSAATENGPIDEGTVNVDYVDRGPADHGARFTLGLATSRPARAGASSSTTARPVTRPGRTRPPARRRSSCSPTGSRTSLTATTRTRWRTGPSRASRPPSSRVPRGRRQRRDPADAVVDAGLRVQRRRRLARGHGHADQQRRHHRPRGEDRLRRGRRERHRWRGHHRWQRPGRLRLHRRDRRGRHDHRLPRRERERRLRVGGGHRHGDQALGRRAASAAAGDRRAARDRRPAGDR